MKKQMLFTLLLFILLTACSNGNPSGTQDSQYEVTKQLVIDLLKTDEGKATLAELLADKELKEQLVIEQDIIKTSIEENLTSEQAMSFWKEAFKDPTFAAAYAKSLEAAHKQLLIDLMEDAHYRKLLLEVMQDPKMEKEITKVIQSSDIREEIKNAIIETFSSPLVQAKLQSIISQSGGASSESQSDSESSQTDTGSGGGNGGGESGGQGGESGGSSSNTP